MARTTGKKKDWGRDVGSRPGHRKSDYDPVDGPGKPHGGFQARSFSGDRGHVHGKPGVKEPLHAPSRKLSTARETFEVRGHTDYGTGGRLMNCVEPGGEYDPLPSAYHRNSGTSSAGFKFRGVRGY